MALIPRAITESSASGGARIDGSLTFNSIKKQYLSRTFAQGNQRTWTWSGWVKRNKGFSTRQFFIQPYTSNGEYTFYFSFDNNDTDCIQIGHYPTSWTYEAITREKYRDVGWYHVFLGYDSTQSTASDRIKLYVNGKLQTLWFDNGTWPSQNDTTYLNKVGQHDIGRSFANYADWQMSQVYLIDGQQLEPTDFGYTDELTGVWRPKKFTGNYDIPVSSATGAKPILVTTGPTGSSTDGSVDTTDPAKASIKIALPLQDDTNDVHHLIKGSGSAVTVTAVDTKYTSSYSKYYGASGDFTDSTDRFSMEVSNSDGHFDIGTGECCIEWWAYYPSTPGSNGYIFRSDTTNGVECYAYAHASGTVAVKFGTFTWDAWPGSGGDHDDFSNGVWNHFCIERNGSTWTAYMNGIPMRTTSNGVDANPGDTMGIGNYNNSNLSYYAKCYLQDFRWYTASKYGGNAFNPPSISVNSFYLPFDGTGDNIGKDQSGKGNDWTPHHFSGGVAIDNPMVSGAAPILNTSNGGRVAVPGVRGQAGIAVTVYNDGGGNKYYLDGVKSTDKNVKFVPGQTVTFDTGDSTCSGHPFRLSANWDGSHTSYSSVDFDGVDGVLQYSNDIGFNFGTGAFTIEFWARVANVTQDHAAVVSLYLFGGGPFIKLRTSNEWSLYFNKDGGGNDTHDVVGIGTYNEWHHLAWVREGTGTNEMKLYMDGIKVYEATYPTNIVGDNSAGHGLTLGKMQPSGGSTYFEGKLRDVRISKGVARYTSNFCPPNEPLTVDGNTSILVCNSSTTTAVSGNYAGIATAIGGVASGTSQNPFKEYVYGTVTGASEGTAGAATTITFPLHAPGELTYYCTNHTGMGGTVSIGATNHRIADPYAQFCKLALPLIGNNTDVSNIVNTGHTAHTLTDDGAAVNYTYANFYGGSYIFDGSNDKITAPNSSDWNFGSGDWTIEFWTYVTGGSSFGYVNLSVTNATSNSGWIVYSNSGQPSIYTTESTSWTKNVDDTVDINGTAWRHVAIVRKDSTLKVYQDGTVSGTPVTNMTSIPDSTLDLEIGTQAGNYWMNGSMSDLRIYKGIAKYSDNFVIPSTSPNIIPDSPSAVAYGSELEEITTGSVLFPGTFDDGTGDYLATSVSSDYTLGTDDFTLECWINLNLDYNGPSILVAGSGSDSYSCILCYQHSANMGLGCYLSSNGSSWDIAMFADLNTGGYSLQRWHHYALTRDGNTFRIFLDGMLKDTYTSSSSLYQNTNQISIAGPRDSEYFRGFISNLRFVKGTAVYTANFTPPTSPLTSITNTKLLCCQSNTSTTEAAAGSITENGNPAASNFTPFITDNDKNLETVRGRPTGYATWNLLDIARYSYQHGGYYTKFDNVNLGLSQINSQWLSTRANMWVSSGKWYYEVQQGNNQYFSIGVTSDDYNLLPTSDKWCNVDNAYCLYPYDGNVYDGSTSRSYMQNAESTGGTKGVVWGVAIDMDNKTLRFYKNGVDLGIAYDSTTATNFVNKSAVAPIAYNYSHTGSSNWDRYNFGQYPFKFQPPEGFKPLAIFNLPRPTIVRPDQYVGAKTFELPDDGSGGSVTLNHDFDLVWTKNRSNGSTNHVLQDSVRGYGDNKNFHPNLTVAQTSTNNIMSVNDRTLTIGSNTNYYDWNVAWSWKAGGSKGTWNVDGEDRGSASAAGLTTGDTSVLNACSINTKAGFSIVKWTQDSGGSGKNIAHGLTQAPNFVIMKHINSTSNWYVTHTSISAATKILYLNTDSDEDTSSDFGNAFPGATYTATSTTGVDGREVMMYSWHNVPGLQKFGHYYANNNDNGPYVNLGFKPSIVMVKVATGGTNNWVIWDSARMEATGPNAGSQGNGNPNGNTLQPDDNTAEPTSGLYYIDFLNDGFKLRVGGSGALRVNANNEDDTWKYIYCAWAEAPSFNLYGGQPASG